jgi:hypothetical protein
MARASSRWMKGGTAMALARVLMPVLDGHPDVFEREWPLRVADTDRDGRHVVVSPSIISMMSTVGAVWLAVSSFSLASCRHQQRAVGSLPAPPAT